MKVWIYKSHLYLIPIIHVSPKSRVRRRQKLLPDSDGESLENEENEEFIATVDALKLIRDPQSNTLAPPDVEKLVWDRISGFVHTPYPLSRLLIVFSYPSALKDHVHGTKGYIPRDIAKTLEKNPALVQKAVETFYTRDAIQLRVSYSTVFPKQPKLSIY